MGYPRSDDRYDGGNRWRERDDRHNLDRGRYQRDREQARHDDDRGFFERAGDELRSWFGDDEAERRRERERRDNGWDRGSERGWFSDSIGGERGERHGASGFDGDYDRGRRDRGPVASGSHYGYRNSSQGRFGVGRSGADIHDPHYSEWRSRQIEDLDRDYEEYRREHQARFEREFGDWRSKRQGQRRLLGQVAERMMVHGSDDQHIGTVDKVRGDRIILARNDEKAGGRHHSIPCSWIGSIDDKVMLSRTAEEAMREWRDEESNRAFFDRDDRGSNGPHMLDRSFSGTYSGREDG